MSNHKTKDTKNTKSDTIHIRLSQQDHTRLKRLATTANMSVSDYIRKSTLSNNPISIVPNGKEILPHLAELSNYVNMVENQQLKKDMEKEVNILWQYLSR